VVLNQQHLFETIFLNEKNRSLMAISLSIAVHLFVVLVIRNINFSNIQFVASEKETYVDLGYQEFEEPPQIVETKIPVAKEISEVIPDKTDNAPVVREMQDQTSDVAGFQKETPAEVIKTSQQSANTSDVPYYKVKPKYPKEALLSGSEGYIMLRLDIKEDGSVENIRITGGERVSVFESEARRAVSKWKYKPYIDEAGTPTKKENHLVRVDFKLADEQAIN
jgi:TonB family protein